MKREVIRCPHRNCHIYHRPQFMTVSGMCRCCGGALKPEFEPKKPAPTPAVKEAAPVAVSESACRSGVADLGSYVAATLVLLRVFTGFTQSQLARRLTVPRTYVSKIENAKATPTVMSVERYAKAFNITPYGLMRMVEELAHA